MPVAISTPSLASNTCTFWQVAAAREAIGDADFFLIARTDARATSSKRGLDEAINRANIYLVRITPNLSSDLSLFHTFTQGEGLDQSFGNIIVLF